MRQHLIAIFLTLFIATSSSTAHTSCLVPEVTKGFEQAKAVFIGQVEEIIAPPNSDEDADFFFALVKFKIEKSWKGSVFDSVTVRAVQGNAFSALPRIHKGERYLVYAEAVVRNEVATDDLLVSACNRTALLPRKSPAPKGFLDSHFDRENGTADLRALDSLMILKRR